MNLNLRTTKKLFTSGVYTLFFTLLILSGCKKEETEAKTETNVTEQKSPASEVKDDFSFNNLPEVVVTVNGEDIPKKDLIQLHGYISSQLQTSGQQKKGVEIAQIAVDELVNSKLLKQESVRRKVSPSKDKVDKEIENIRSRFPDEDTFKKALAEKGLTPEEVRSNITDQLALNEMLQKEVEANVSISDEEIKNFYDSNPNYFKTEDSVKASHILVKVEEGAPEAKEKEAKDKIESILAEVKAGADFAETAKKKSEGPTGPKGGDLGFFPRGQMVKPFEEVAFSLKKGETSDIVRTAFGFHIIKVTDKQKAGMKPLEEAKESISAFLMKTAGDKHIKQLVENLRKDAVIQKFI